MDRHPAVAADGPKSDRLLGTPKKTTRELSAMSVRTLMLFSILCLFWGIPYFFIKLALLDVSPICIAWGRITLGAIVLVPVAWQRRALRPALRHKGAIIAFAIAELVVPFSLIALAE